MLGITTTASTSTNNLSIHIPDELKDMDLQVIILPAAKNKEEQIEFFSDAELQQLSTVHMGADINDKEDYSKW